MLSWRLVQRSISNLCRLGDMAGSIKVPDTTACRSILILFPIDWVSGDLNYLLDVMLICFDIYLEELIGRRWPIEG